MEALKARYDGILERIQSACGRAGRSADDVTLVAVSKTFPLDTVLALHALGHRDFGENKVQELVEKSGAAPGAWAGGTLRWHMIGHLQRNKARQVAPVADLFHALDSRRLAEELDRRCEAAGRCLDCLVQVNVSGEESKFGLDPDDLPRFLDGQSAWPQLRIRGLMTLAAPVEDPEFVRPQFVRLRELAARWSGEVDGGLKLLSMGMSGDFEVAIEEGATHVRVGSAIFGERSYP